MSKLIDVIKNELLKKIIEIIWPYILPSITIAITYISGTYIPIFKTLIKDNFTKWLFLSFCILIGMLIRLIIYIFSIKKKLTKYENKKELIFNSEYGCYYDKQGLYYCTSCKSKNIESPLKKYDDRYKCMVKECGKEYYKDEEIFVEAENIPDDFKP